MRTLPRDTPPDGSGPGSPGRPAGAVRCGRVANLLRDYAAGELAVGEGAALEEHLSWCPRCAREVQEYLGVIRLAASLPDPVPPPEAERRIKALLAAALGHPTGDRPAGDPT